jgi:hypothetical protein
MTERLVLVVVENVSASESAQVVTCAFEAIDRLLAEQFLRIWVVDDDGVNRLVDPQETAVLARMTVFARRVHPDGSPMTIAIERMLDFGPDTEHAVIDAELHALALRLARSILHG